MKSSTTLNLLATAGLAAAALFSEGEYDRGEVHEMIMGKKFVSRTDESREHH
jgi:hypothetical protein